MTCSSFFFSSRRRHTISKRDWSSDVCSSDLRPGARSPRLVAIAARLDELVAHTVGLDPSAPASRLLEVALADVLPRLGTRARPGSTLPVAADCRGERLEGQVDGDGGRTRRARAAEVDDHRLRIAGEPPA